jgi:hypothetical protein
MRSFVAGLLLLLSFLTGTAGLGAYAAHEVLLDPAHAGPMLNAALAQQDVRNRILEQVVPGYGSLPAQVRDRVDTVAETPAARRAIEQVSLDTHGNLDLSSLQGEIVRALRANGLPQVASLVAAQPGVSSVQVPSTYFSRYTEARDDTWLIATRGAVVTAVLFVVALLVSPRRRRTVATIGIVLLLCCAVDVVLFRLLPGLVRTAPSSALGDAAAAVVTQQQTAVLLAMVPVALAGAGLVVASLLLPEDRHPSRA